MEETLIPMAVIIVTLAWMIIKQDKRILMLRAESEANRASIRAITEALAPQARRRLERLLLNEIRNAQQGSMSRSS